MEGIKPIISAQGAHSAENFMRVVAGTDKEPSHGRSPSNISSQEFVIKMQAVLSSTNISVGFAKYGNNKTAVVVYNKETGEVIREIPPKEIQQLELRMDEMIGMIFNQKA